LTTVPKSERAARTCLLVDDLQPFGSRVSLGVRGLLLLLLLLLVLPPLLLLLWAWGRCDDRVVCGRKRGAMWLQQLQRATPGRGGCCCTAARCCRGSYQVLLGAKGSQQCTAAAPERHTVGCVLMESWGVWFQVIWILGCVKVCRLCDTVLDWCV